MSAPVRTAAVDAIPGVPTRAIATVNATSTIAAAAWSWTTYAPAFTGFVAEKHHDRRPRT